jgi:peptidoglycan lytic transglycosylase D
LFQLAFRVVLAITVLPVVLPAGATAKAGEMLAMNNQLGTWRLDTSTALPGSTFSAAKGSNDELTLTEDGNLPQPNLWQRIRSGFALPELDNPLVARHERWYASQPDYVARMTERARLYLYYIVREVERRGMPTEIALLPMIESAFNPTAYSMSNASGIWQFIPSTGKHFGMQQNWWHDDRRDVISATNGALDYLQTLHDEFGDWQLALAAYNCGEHCIERAQKRNLRHHKPTDFAHLRLPRETRNYVPKLMAMKHIIADPASFGLVLADIPNDPYFAAISPSHHIDVTLAAQLAGMSMDDFKALNPANSRPVILHDDSTYILLPVDKADTFISNLDAHDKPLVSWQPYQSRKGESLEKIATRFDIPVAKLKSANGIFSYVRVSNGQKLLVPAEGDDANEEFAAFNMHLAPTLGDGHALVHVVRRGETLSGIAHHYHISLARLKASNGHRSLIRPGQRIIIAGRGTIVIHRRHHHNRVTRVSRRSNPVRRVKTRNVAELPTSSDS